MEQLEMVEEAARNDAKLIVLVEMATTAYCFFDRAEIAPYVEPIPGPTTERFGELAARYGCYIVVGMPEVDPETDIYYNSLALVGPDGVVGKYRKTHSFISENTWAKDGDLDLPVFRTELGNLGWAYLHGCILPGNGARSRPARRRRDLLPDQLAARKGARPGLDNPRL